MGGSARVDRGIINKVITDMRGTLRLEDWYIEAAEDTSVQHGFVVFDRELRRATILYNPETITSFHVRHEMIHILLHDLVYVGSNGRSTEIMEVINLFEERVCNVVAEAIES